jgi:2-keto-4-pentenoate hydratase
MNSQSLAAELRRAYEVRVPCSPIRDRIENADAAYAVQEANTQYWLARGRRLVGRKIGLTAKSVQQQLGVDEPDFGMLFADMARCDGEDIARDVVIQPKVEGEVALVLEGGLEREDLTITDVIAATAYCLPAIEIVDSRIASWDIRLVDTIADNASSGLFVLGTRPVGLADLDLPACHMSMKKNGEQTSSGYGRDCLGNPLNSALWLARTMIRVGRPLRAGDIVMTGALGPMVAVAAGDAVEVQITGLGSVRTNFV